MIVEGVISIKEGENPKYIQEKLLNFLEERELKNRKEKSERRSRRFRIGFRNKADETDEIL